MCGFAGFATITAPPERDAVAAATARLAHRGPDDAGLAHYAAASLGHRRLSIIDAAGSPQPWKSDCGRYALVFNGEIYNYLELRSELEREGLRFRSRGDTEVLLQLLVSLGPAALARLNGMFAFALWDDRDGILLLGRDRLGKKPLFYARVQGGLAFASELPALRCFPGFDAGLDEAALADYFAHQYVGGARTIYAGAARLPPAHWLRLQAGVVTTTRYWSPPLEPVAAAPRCGDFAALFDDAVALRLRSDVPVGAFLSGGLDSALVLASVVADGARVAAFTVGFPDASYDERPAARATARHFGVELHEAESRLDDVGGIGAALAAFGEPFADPSAIPAWHVAQLARRHVKVALSGDGVDELFGGYRRYLARLWAHRLRAVPLRAAERLIRALAAILPEGDGYYATDIGKQVRLFDGLLRNLDENPGDPRPRTFTLSGLAALVPDLARHDRPRDLESELDLGDRDALDRMMLVDLQTYLAEDILAKLDRTSMSHGLEVRSPFLDYRIVEFACRLPSTWKIRSGEQKHVVRQCLGERVPPAVRARRKHGFAVPLGRWFRGALRARFEDLVLGAPPAPLSAAEVGRLWGEHQRGRADHGFKLWSVLIFCEWLARERATGSGRT